MRDKVKCPGKTSVVLEKYLSSLRLSVSKHKWFSGLRAYICHHFWTWKRLFHRYVVVVDCTSVKLAAIEEQSGWMYERQGRKCVMTRPGKADCNERGTMYCGGWWGRDRQTCGAQRNVWMYGTMDKWREGKMRCLSELPTQIVAFIPRLRRSGVMARTGTRTDEAPDRPRGCLHTRGWEWWREEEEEERCVKPSPGNWDDGSDTLFHYCCCNSYLWSQRRFTILWLIISELPQQQQPEWLH